jgi:DNA repair protein RadC
MKHAKRIHEDGNKPLVSSSTPKLPVVTPKEYKIVAVRECIPVNSKNLCDNPRMAWQYWQLNVKTMPLFNPDVECLVAILLDTRRRAKGHALIAIGTLDAILFHPREVFRAAVIGSAASIS